MNPDGRAVIGLRLEGPMQSWGSDALWDYRGTDLYPTKSGVIGILSCALGYGHDDLRIVELSNAVEIGLRIDRAGVRMLDFQTVTGNPLLNAQGKRRSGSQTIISRREYLQDASVLVAVEGPADQMAAAAAALRFPRWPYYLGRKNCIPTRPILEHAPGAFESVDDVLARAPLAERHDLGPTYTWIVEANDRNAVTFTRNDERIAVPRRQFRTRRVARREEQGPCT